ncbi:MAG TPA: 3-phosphoglycerate dehydrogenase family protein [Fimbriimonadaceae bacterium]|nr:3-phosphoglycerate dehydrogenase family protein [Fimbriimonadaceae bacterium]HRJ32659.1 3-phosphoglycerate dehydrogenase family protein [Fimbriimonadaceae bacterium]
MKILVADAFEASGLEGLRPLASELLYEPDLKDEALGQRIQETGVDVLVVRSTKVTEAMMEGSRLSLIIRAGAGYNTIDVAAASRKGIFVSNCPGKNSQAVAELAFGLMLAADRHIPDCVSTLRQGEWNKKAFSRARGLYGRTLGLIGMGKIGQEMIVRARAFGMNIVAFSRWMTPDVAATLGIGRATRIEEVALQSDFVSVHVSLTPETRGMLGESFFQSLRPGSVFVNTSRAEVVDQAAMLKAIDENGIFAALDVFEGEPTTGTGSYDGPLKNHPQVYCTHHIGASTDQAQEAVAEETVRIVREYKLTGQVPNVVNVSKGASGSHLLVVRHLDRVGVLAHVLDALKDEGINVQEMENIVLGGAESAIAQISVDREPSDSTLTKVKLNANIFDCNIFPIAQAS